MRSEHSQHETISASETEIEGKLKEELLRLQSRLTDQLEAEERRRVDTVEQWKKQVDELQTLLDTQQASMQKLKGDHEEDKVVWNRQHQDHVLSVEKLYTNRIKTLETELFEVRHEVELLRAENARVEVELANQQNSSLVAGQIQELIQFVTDEVGPYGFMVLHGQISTPTTQAASYWDISSPLAQCAFRVPLLCAGFGLPGADIGDPLEVVVGPDDHA